MSPSAAQEVVAEAFVLRGGQLEKQPEAEPVAFGGDADWDLGGAHFSQAQCTDIVWCLFEEDGEVCERRGPFKGVALSRGVIRSGDQVIATLRGSYWQSAFTRRAWPRVRLVQPCAPPPRG